MSNNTIDFTFLSKPFSNNDEYLDTHVCNMCRFYLYFNHKVSLMPDTPYKPCVIKNNEKCVICQQLMYTRYSEDRYFLMICDYKPSITVREREKKRVFVNYSDYIAWLTTTEDGKQHIEKYPMLEILMNDRVKN